MKKLTITIFSIIVTLAAAAQHKTPAHYWGRIPSYPANTSMEAYRKLLDDIQLLRSEINEEIELQNRLMEQKVSTVNPGAVANPQNMKPADIQQMMKRTQDRTDFMNEITAKFNQLNTEFEQLTADFEKEYASAVKLLEEKAEKLCPDGAMSVSDEKRVPACNAALKELEAAKEKLVTKWFQAGNSPFKAWLGKFASAKKSFEPRIIQVRDDAFIGTGINVKGLPCADNLKGVNEYLGMLQQVFEKAIDHSLLKN
ncbi:MAG TPA: hypothetical protein VD996_09070 [Chitinophagaceae bacterium]|nr:hypothetical protein [Chitinophagaceae bacterium]